MCCANNIVNKFDVFKKYIFKMGNNDSKIVVFSSYKQLKKIDHQILGELAETIDTAKKMKYFIKEYNCADIDQHKEQLKKYKNRKIKNNKYVLNIMYIEEKINNQFCGSNCKTYLCFDYFECDLHSLFKQKVQRKKFFTEQELIDILSGCVNALIYIQDNGLKHYHLSKKSIFFISKEIKMLDTVIINKSHPYYQILAKESVGEDIFLSPQLIQELKLESFDPYLSPKSDIYTLGVLMLHLACLQSLASFYDYENYEIDSQSLLFKVQKIKYSNNLKQIIKSMIEINEQDRPGLITLQNFLENTTRRQSNRITRTDSFRINTQNKIPVRKSQPKMKTSNDDEIKKEEVQKTLREQIKQITLSSNVSNMKKIEKKASNLKQQNSIFSKNQQTKQNFFIKKDANTSSFKKDPHTSTFKKENLESNNKIYKTIQSYNDSPIQQIEISTTIKSKTAIQESKAFAKLFYPNCCYYQGEIVNNVPNGNGILYYSTGKLCYSGSWKNNLFHGAGTLYNQKPFLFNNCFDCRNFTQLNDKWIKYEGEFYEGKRHGFGTLYLANQQRFLGKFENDKIKGFGTFYERDGEIFNGEWQNNIIIKTFD